MTEAFLARIERGLRELRAARFLAAHEAFEDGWRESEGAEKQLLQVLVLWATALAKLEQGNQRGAERLMVRALERLAVPPIADPPLDLERLREALERSWETLEQGRLELPDWGPEHRSP